MYKLASRVLLLNRRQFLGLRSHREYLQILIFSVLSQFSGSFLSLSIPSQSVLLLPIIPSLRPIIREPVVTMPPCASSTKAVAKSLILRRAGLRSLISLAADATPIPNRRLCGIAGKDSDLVARGNRQEVCSSSLSSSSVLCNVNNVQRRSFLGCGDGDEGSVLSKVYEEKRVLGYSQEQLYNVVAAVDMYRDFLPWCQRSDILRYYPDGSFDAELEIGFKFLVESYVSHVELERPKRIKTTATDTTLFDHLINIWEFSPGPVPGSCNLYFLVDFKFQSPLYRQVASMFFKEVVARLVGSLDDRCRLVYGPGTRVIEDSYGHNS